jgi:hypothetical protein
MEVAVAKLDGIDLLQFEAAQQVTYVKIKVFVQSSPSLLKIRFLKH